MFRVLSLTLLAGLATLLLSACASPTRQARQPAPEQTTLRVLSWNVNYGLAGDPGALKAILDADAQLVLLQESTPDWETTLRANLSKQYPHMHFVHDRGAGGLAVLSKHKLKVEEVLPPAGRGWFPASRVVVEAPLGDVQVVQVHLRPPFSDTGNVVSGYWESGDIHLGEVKAWAPKIEDNMPTLMVGDFNEDESGAAISWLEDHRGMRNALMEFSPGAETWRWNTSFGEVTHTLDHILYNKHLEPLDTRVLKVGRSDHFPLVGEFAMAR